MKRIIAAFDSQNFSESTMKYAIHLSKQANAHLVGIFLGDPFCVSCNSYHSIADPAGVALATKINKSETMSVDSNVNVEQIFATKCHAQSVRFTIRHDDTLNLQALIKETVFADLLVINVHETLPRFSDAQPSPFLKSLLKSAYCPVLLVPDHFVPIESIVVLYNGDPSSVFAVELFSYLFPEMDEFQTQIISFKQSGSLTGIPEDKLMRDWVKSHFSNIGYNVLPGDSGTQLLGELKAKYKDSVVIAGVDQKSNLSRWLHPSIGDDLIKKLSNPLFIAHN